MTNSPKSKAQERWIEFDGDPFLDEKLFLRNVAGYSFKASSLSSEVIKFIEYSAYADLLARIERATKALELAEGTLETIACGILPNGDHVEGATVDFAQGALAEIGAAQEVKE